MRTLGACLALVLALAAPLAAHGASMEIAGFRLGDAISQYQGKIETAVTETDLASPYLVTAALAPVAGYRSGYVTWGNCVSPGRIARIKMNYADDSREFYEQVLAELKKRFGQPKEWRGNPFGTLRIWKWSVKGNGGGEDVSIILQHYLGGDDSFTRGNSIRIASASILKQERECHMRAKADSKIQPAQEPPAKLGIEHFLPH